MFTMFMSIMIINIKFSRVFLRSISKTLKSRVPHWVSGIELSSNFKTYRSQTFNSLKKNFFRETGILKVAPQRLAKK